jgi:uncharacterized protein (TIGR03792 family)
MVIEWLKFKVAPNLRERFIQTDDRVWTAALSRYPGFLGKEVWIEPTNQHEVVIVARWATREDWKSISPKELDETEAIFSQAIGKENYEMVEAKEYQLRKFPRAET